MSHELRTPMNAILGYAQLLNMGELGSSQKKGVNHILKSGKHLLDLINEVLDIAGIEAGRVLLSFEPVNLTDLVHELKDLVHPMAKEKNITITVPPFSGKPLFVWADKQRLNQVLINLLNNAIKYNRADGTVFIQLSLADEKDNIATKARITVRDTGAGISQHNIPKLFNPFERLGAEKTTTEGTGLGLAVVKRLMADLNGTIGVESEVGQGSTFWIELPLCDLISDPETLRVSGNASPPETSAQTGTILYIEDNASNIELVEQIIGTHRPHVKLVCDMYGKKALQLAADHKPDLIFLDLHLPDMQGSEVFRLLQENTLTCNTPVVIITADAMPEQQNKLLKAGVKRYLTKPFDIPSFLSELDKWINNSTNN
jgi:CheY-like chemotaxis protein/anti-sigma regulatory factor (Ser/Thr protein kinase)